MARENGERHDVCLQTTVTPEQAEALRKFVRDHGLSISGAIRGLALHQLGHLLNHHKPQCPSCGGLLTWRIKGTKRTIGKSVLGAVYTCSCKWWSPVDDYLKGIGKGEPHLGNDRLPQAR